VTEKRKRPRKVRRREPTKSESDPIAAHRRCRRRSSGITPLCSLGFRIRQRIQALIPNPDEHTVVRRRSLGAPQLRPVPDTSDRRSIPINRHESTGFRITQVELSNTSGVRAACGEVYLQDCINVCSLSFTPSLTAPTRECRAEAVWGTSITSTDAHRILIPGRV